MEGSYLIFVLGKITRVISHLDNLMGHIVGHKPPYYWTIVPIQDGEGNQPINLVGQHHLGYAINE